MVGLVAALDRFIDDDAGATAIEYGLIAALIAVGCILAMTSFGGGLGGLFNSVQAKSSNAIDNANV